MAIGDTELSLGPASGDHVADCARCLGRPFIAALETLDAARFGSHLVFKGGMSLSKACDVIARFSGEHERCLIRAPRHRGDKPPPALDTCRGSPRGARSGPMASTSRADPQFGSKRVA